MLGHILWATMIEPCSVKCPLSYVTKSLQLGPVVTMQLVRSQRSSKIGRKYPPAFSVVALSSASSWALRSLLVKRSGTGLFGRRRSSSIRRLGTVLVQNGAEPITTTLCTPAAFTSSIVC